VSFGVHLIWTGQMTTGALVASMILVWRVLTPFYSMCTMIPRLDQIRNSIVQVNKLMDLDTEAMEARSAARLPRVAGRITFSRATLRYGEGTDAVLQNLSFDARPGDIVAVTGANGSGKSSLLKLVKGLYRAESGAVLVDGFDIRQLDAADLRRQIAYVPQQPDFFHGTVLENLRLANPLIGEDAAANALLLADAWDEVQAMPQGLNTIIGRHGEEAMPVGLAVRLSLARAYLHAAPIMLIDELPNAIMSGRAGRNLKDYIARIKGKRTTILATYRTDYMALADTIVMLRRGEAALVGTRDEILNPSKEKEAA
jgi:ABC-type bacteriocin/lantibiotic exporter with double-glycine peptidase domain